MANFHAYWEGITLATLDAKQIDDDELSRAPAVDSINLAFRMYYSAIQVAKKVGESTGNRRIGDIFSGDIRDAATAGWGLGVTDLRQAFHHLANNDGKWKDTACRSYSGRNGVGSPVNRGQGHYYTFHAAQAFFYAIDSKIEKVKKAIEEHNQAMDSISDTVRGANTLGTREWDKVGECLSTIKNVTGKTEKYMWLAPLASDRLGKSLDASSDSLKVVNKFLGAASDTRAAVSAFDNAKRAGFTDMEAGLLAALEKGMEKVPVLGQLYAKAIGIIPTVAVNFQQIVETKRQQYIIAVYGPAAGQKMPWLHRR